jgi:hypothetical protein
MEVPGQYLDIKEPMPTQHVKVDRVLPDIEMAELNIACHRKIVIRGNDTKLYHFVVEATMPPYPSIGSSDERILQVSIHFACFPRTTARILTPAELRVRAAALAADEPVHGEGDAGAPPPDELAHTLHHWARAALPAHLGGQGRGAADAGARGLLGAPRHDPGYGRLEVL